MSTATTDSSTGKHPDFQQLLQRSLGSLQLAIELFNRPSEVGRCESVLMLCHHSFELILKALILDRTGTATDEGRGYSYQFDTCLRIAEEQIKVIDKNQRRFLSMLDNLRDSATHYYLIISEDQLYVFAQGSVSLYDLLLAVATSTRLVDHLPARVLPLSSRPPRDLHVLVDAEFGNLREALRGLQITPAEAMARLRPLLALAVGAEDSHRRMTTEELRKATERLRDEADWRVVFPEIANLRLSVEGEGISVVVKIVKDVLTAMPVKVLKPGDAEEPQGTPIVKEVNPLDKFTMGLKKLAGHLKLSMPRVLALVREYHIQEDPEAYRMIRVGSIEQKLYSKKALDVLRGKIDDVEEVWKRQRTSLTRRSKPRPNKA